MKTEDIDYRDGALTMRGFLAYDETLSGKRPGVLVVHEGWGLGKNAMRRAEMLAQLGYVAFAADMYGDRRQLSGREEMMEVIGDLLKKPAKLRQRGRAGLATLAALPQVDVKKLGAIGFCFGGTTVLELARDGADLAGVVSFHGGLGTEKPAVKGAVKASVLVLTGADDPMATAAQVNTLEEEMRQAGADWQVLSYGGAMHGFTNPEADGSFSPAVLYHERTDRRSWLAMRNFFEEVFARG